MSITVTYRTRRKETYIFKIHSRRKLWEQLKSMACRSTLKFNFWDAGRVLAAYNQRRWLLESRHKLGVNPDA